MPLTSIAVRSKGKGPTQRLVEGEEMLRDRNAGMQVSELATKYGCSPATVKRRIAEAVASRLAPTVDQYREEQNALLDDLASRWNQQLAAAMVMIQEGEVTKDMGLVDRGMTRHAEALKGLQNLSERRAKLNGLDAPVKAEVTVTVQDETDRAIAELRERMARRREPARQG